MTPEQHARIEIDRQLIGDAWVVQDHRSMNIRANLGVAVREFPLDTGPVDYLTLRAHWKVHLNCY